MQTQECLAIKQEAVDEQAQGEAQAEATSEEQGMRGDAPPAAEDSPIKNKKKNGLKLARRRLANLSPFCFFLRSQRQFRPPFRAWGFPLTGLGGGRSPIGKGGAQPTAPACLGCRRELTRARDLSGFWRSEFPSIVRVGEHPGQSLHQD